MVATYKMPRRHGDGGLEDVGVWGFASAMFAAVAGLSLAIVAATLLKRPDSADESEFTVGYNALATTVDRR